MSESRKLATEEKALKTNLNSEAYGSFAEIGAGQEVARWFFRAGKASSTIAKTISAYDMSYSDYLYGAEENHRYVCESRVRKMLEREYDVLTERTSGRKKDETCYFAFSDTIASKKRVDGGGHGWIGIKFQNRPLAPANQIILHVRLFDEDVLSQQEAVGILGVNLVHAAIHSWQNPQQIVSELKDGLKKHKLEIDMIEFSGPAFAQVDNRVMSVHLVELGYTNAVIFTPEGKTLQPTDALFRKSLLVQRGRFRPLTNLHLEMFEAGKKRFLKDPAVKSESLVTFFEITLNELKSSGSLDVDDFLARVDMIGTTGQNVMISNYAEYFRLSEFFNLHTQSKIGMIMGVGHLKLIFDEKFYGKVPGGMMSALGLLFGRNVTGLVFPSYSMDLHRPSEQKNPSGTLLTTRSFEVEKSAAHLFQHLLANQSLVDITDVKKDSLQINSDKILDDILNGRSGWENQVPPTVAKLIQEKGLFQKSRAAKKRAA